MKVSRFLVALALIAGFAGSAAAQPSASMFWSSCSTRPSNVNYLGVTNRLYVTANNLAPGPYEGSEVSITFVAASGVLPNIWRFDADGGGCMASAFTTTTTLGQTGCAQLELGTPLAIVGYLLNFPGDPIGAGHVLAGNTHDPRAIDGSVASYLLFRFNFDMSQAVDLGCDTDNRTGEQMCIVLKYAKVIQNSAFVDLSNTNQFFVTYNGAAANCPGVTPAKPATWGSIKNQYR